MKKYELSRNGNPGNQGAFWTVFPVLLLLLAGCAGKQLPLTVALTGAQEQEASALLQQVRKNSCPDFLDADVTLSWQGYGQHRIVNATLQATRKGGFRLSGLDPLGRPFFILATDGTNFTLVDNLQGRGYIGTVDSAFLREYIPAGLELTTCFSFLTAQLPEKDIPLVRFARTGKNKTFWVVFAQKNGKTRQVEIDPVRGRLVRQLLVDDEQSIIFDVRYDRYPTEEKNCAVPAQLTAEGKDLSGSLQLSFNKLYTGTRLPDDIFHLQVPEHFTVTEVE